ncbi:MAG: hypothetical protein IPK64_03905 [bacterium]|nr:hypothetical protein [bacterium]
MAAGNTGPAALRAPIVLADMVAPVAVLELDFYRDGGTLTGRLRDASGRHLSFCVDRRLRPDGADLAAAPTAGIIYVDAPYPTDPRAVPLAHDGVEESAFIALLEGSPDDAAAQQVLASWREIRRCR